MNNESIYSKLSPIDKRNLEILANAEERTLAAELRKAVKFYLDSNRERLNALKKNVN